MCTLSMIDAEVLFMWQVQRERACRAERFGGHGMGVGHVGCVQGGCWDGGELVCCCDERSIGWVFDVWDVVRRECFVFCCWAERKE